MVKTISYLLKIFSTALLVVALVSPLGCAKKKAETLTEDGLDPNATFFDVVYQVRASRQTGTATWVATEGVSRYKFLRTLTSEDGVDSGSFTIQFTNYKEPQLFNATACSGGYEGTFTGQGSTTGEDDDDGTYNPSDPYNPGDTGGSETEDTTTTPSSYYFAFNMAVTRRSLASGCTSVSPLDSFSITVIRFSNGDLQVTNPSRSLEFYLVPEII